MAERYPEIEPYEHGILDAGERRGIGRGMKGEPVALAGGKQLALPREVVVHGRPLNPRPPGHLGDGGLRGADLLMQFRRRRGDARTRFLLAAGALLQVVGPLGR